jgi:hypothetical protein
MDTIERKIKMPVGLALHMDDDVKLVLEFIWRNINVSRRIKVANSVKELAPILFQSQIDASLSKEESFVPLAFIPPDM